MPDPDEPTVFSPFSHAPAAEPTPVPGRRPTLELAAVIAAPADAAFRAMTDSIHLWWPLADVSTWGEDTYVEFDGDAVVETSPRNETAVWAQALGWQQDRWIELEWSPDAPVLQASTLLVEFGDAVLPSGATGTALDWRVDDGQPGAAWSEAFERLVRFLGGRVDLD